MAAFGATPVQARQLSCDERAVQEPLRDVDEKDCTAEEGEAHTLLYILFLEQELTKAKARLAVFHAEARQQVRLTWVRRGLSAGLVRKAGAKARRLRPRRWLAFVPLRDHRLRPLTFLNLQEEVS